MSTATSSTRFLIQRTISDFSKCVINSSLTNSKHPILFHASHSSLLHSLQVHLQTHQAYARNEEWGIQKWVRTWGLGRGVWGSGCFIEWWKPFSFPKTWLCQRKLRVLNFEATVSISNCLDLKKKKKLRRKV